MEPEGLRRDSGSFLLVLDSTFGCTQSFPLLFLFTAILELHSWSLLSEIFHWKLFANVKQNKKRRTVQSIISLRFFLFIHSFIVQHYHFRPKPGDGDGTGWSREVIDWIKKQGGLASFKMPQANFFNWDDGLRTDRDIDFAVTFGTRAKLDKWNDRRKDKKTAQTTSTR